MTEIDIHIPGQPKAQKRHRTGRGRRYDPSSKDKKVIRQNLLFYKPARPLTGPLQVELEAYFQTPKSWSGAKQERHEGQFRPKKPDVDNIEKIYFDAMNGMLWEDDNQVVDTQVRKYYSMKPRVLIRIKQLEEVTP